MSEKDLDIAIEKCKRIMEFDTRTLENPESENGFIFEKIYDLLQFLRELQIATDTNVGGMTDDTIYRAAAIDAVKKYFKMIKLNPEILVDSLITLPPAPPGWIPCSMRMPEDGRYLCDYGDCIDFGRVTHGKWYVDGVIAWMPIPEPYRPEGEKE